MEAFGPYAGVQEIDFRLLKDANMFLIHGSTGGGKTTILDAICFALYGETSGNEREPGNMRSHFAKDDQLTQVKFTFKVGQEAYLVHRIPGQERPKKVGEGFTDQMPKAWVYELGKEEPLAAGVNEVKDKIIDLIGFDADQFRQVIIIPQGQFRKLLVAKSEERQKILGEIFQTRKYRRVEDKIRDEERALKNEVASIKERRKEQIKNIKYRPDTLLEALIDKENIDTSQVMAEVETLRKTQEEESNKILEEIKTLDEDLRKMSTQMTVAINNNEKHIDKEKLKVQYDALISQEKVYKDKENQYYLGQKALPLQTKEQYINNLALQQEEITKDVLKVKKEIESLEVTYKEVTAQVEKCKVQELETKKWEQSLTKALEEYRPKSTKLIRLEADKTMVKKEIDKALERQKALKDQKETMDKAIQEAEESLNQRQILNDKLRKEELESEKLSVTLVQKRQLVKLEEKHKELQINYQKISASLKVASSQYAKVSQGHNTMLQAWVKGQAGELARNLKEDQACPVCGSKHHPNPAIITAQMPTEKELEQKKEALDKAQVLFQETRTKLAEITTEGKGNADQVNAQKEILASYAQTPLEEIEKAYKVIEKEKTSTKKTLVALEKIQEKVIKEKEEIIKVDKELVDLQESGKENSDRFTVLTTQIDHIKKEIPEELRVPKALDDYIDNLERTIQRQKEIHNNTILELEKIKIKKTQLETTDKEKKAQLKAAIIRYDNDSKDFKDQREKAGFETLEAYKDAYKSQDELEGLNKEIKAYQNLYSAIEGQYKKRQEETKDSVLVDIKELEDKYGALEKTKDTLGRSHQTITLEIEHNKMQMNTIQKSTKQIMDKEKRYAIVGTLYDAVRGKNIKGLSFERFIQSSLFEDVLIRANERLSLMSNNRYELYRSDNRERLSAQSGLDLEVLDTYTGKKRHVRTLSGGEGFMASLSLALGLADVVQSYAGGISLDTIFIDEGFGTLDTESLDAAIKTLIDLQKSGRLVGIISHVPELKERIGARLEVVTTQRGSRAEFHI